MFSFYSNPSPYPYIKTYNTVQGVALRWGKEITGEISSLEVALFHKIKSLFIVCSSVFSTSFYFFSCGFSLTVFCSFFLFYFFNYLLCTVCTLPVFYHLTKSPNYVKSQLDSVN